MPWGQPGKLKEKWCVDKSWQYASQRMMNMWSCLWASRPQTVATCQPLFLPRHLQTASCTPSCTANLRWIMKNKVTKHWNSWANSNSGRKCHSPTWISLEESKQSNRWTHCVGIPSDITLIVWPNVLDLFSHLWSLIGTRHTANGEVSPTKFAHQMAANRWAPTSYKL